VNDPTLDSLRKRILLFYFAGGINLFMGVYVMSAGAGTVDSGTLLTISLVFIVFAVLNFYVARKLRTRWSQLVRHAQAQDQPKPEAANSRQVTSDQ
jgi:hypothetical protein